MREAHDACTTLSASLSAPVELVFMLSIKAILCITAACFFVASTCANASGKGTLRVSLHTNKKCHVHVAVDLAYSKFTLYYNEPRHISFHPTNNATHIYMNIGVTESSEISQHVLFKLEPSFIDRNLTFGEFEIKVEAFYECNPGYEGANCEVAQAPTNLSEVLKVPMSQTKDVINFPADKTLADTTTTTTKPPVSKIKLESNINMGEPAKTILLALMFLTINAALSCLLFMVIVRFRKNLAERCVFVDLESVEKPPPYSKSLFDPDMHRFEKEKDIECANLANANVKTGVF
uniref:Uncharacterized protein n=1 Tax=Caenorhabditis japonica TaxID=281687 RepID=A0A8R1I296_CAEJA